MFQQRNKHFRRKKSKTSSIFDSPNQKTSSLLSRSDRTYKSDRDHLDLKEDSYSSSPTRTKILGRGFQSNPILTDSFDSKNQKKKATLIDNKNKSKSEETIEEGEIKYGIIGGEKSKDRDHINLTIEEEEQKIPTGIEKDIGKLHLQESEEIFASKTLTLTQEDRLSCNYKGNEEEENMHYTPLELNGIDMAINNSSSLNSDFSPTYNKSKSKWKKVSPSNRRKNGGGSGPVMRKRTTPRTPPPPKTTIAAFLMILVGLILLFIGIGLRFEEDSKEKERGLCLIVLGLITFVPGSYAGINLYGAYQGWQGFDYSSIPSYDD